MATINNLISKTSKYLTSEQVSDIKSAFSFAEKSHKGQFRASGEPFIQHPLKTAIYLSNLRLDSEAISAALLHDVVEDCGINENQITKVFGEQVSKLVIGVTKLNRAEVLNHNNTIEETTDITSSNNAASIRKMLISMSDDVRVVLIKLADRMHNMQTLGSLPKEKRLSIAQETLEIYAPLAHRLGIWEMKWMLEDLAFQNLEPESYQKIAELLNSKRSERENYIKKVISKTSSELKSLKITADVQGRPKHLFSIHKKIKKYSEMNRGISEIYDLFALRIIVNSVSDCYAALGAVHSLWHPITGVFDDYIAAPKDNLYQSLHTTVICEENHPVEIQIRTKEMHELSEYGVAAHWLYKEGDINDSKFEHKMTWIRQLLEWQREISGSEEFVESFKTDIFNDQVFVYTPKGDIKELPIGATVLDFAYRIHTEIGHRCIGGKRNGKLVSLNTKISNGDTIEIMTSKNIKGPSLDWINPDLNYVQTTSAKTKIRQWFNRQQKEFTIANGKTILQKQLKKINEKISLEDLAKHSNFLSLDEMLLAIGSGNISLSQIINILPENQPQLDNAQVSKKIKSPTSGIEVLGVVDLLTKIAKCCNPIPGDSIIGFITRSTGVTVHIKSCINILNENEKERLIPVNWREQQPAYPVDIKVESWDKVGLLNSITSVVSNEQINIGSCVSQEYDGFSTINLNIFVNGIEQLGRVISKIEALDPVIEVNRVN